MIKFHKLSGCKILLNDIKQPFEISWKDICLTQTGLNFRNV